jgi:MFS family permease
VNALQRHPVGTIVLAQLFGTSLWFSPNSAVDSLVQAWHLSPFQLGQITSATQLGFILGTLVLATTGLADRFPASRIFAIASLLGAVFNAGFAYLASGVESAMAFRFAVGVCLAGIYPLGMKMVIAWTRGGAGSTLGLLVAMLTLGSALPHAVRAAGGGLSWQAVVLSSSVLALAGGLAIRWLGDGPHLPRAGRGSVRWGTALKAFADPAFRSSAFGYFGHMWELYAFWTLVPFLVADVVKVSNMNGLEASRVTSAWSFAVIGIGALGCVFAGRLSQRFGSPSVAAVALALSGLMCLAYPFLKHLGLAVSIVALLVWGMAVIADSAQFSAVSAQVCPPESVGGALAIQNSIGFLITVFAITLVTSEFPSAGSSVAWYLLPGPLAGLLCFWPLIRSSIAARRPGTA